jgi:hypothetical protein
MKKRIFCSLAILVIGCCCFTKHTVRIFPYAIPSSIPFHPEWELSSLSHSEQKQIFSQPYTYLGKGEQSIAFESEDHRYVLKFPYHKHRVPPSWFHWVPFLGKRYDDKLTRSIHKNLTHDARSLLLAFEAWKDETGLIALHWNRTSTLCRSIIVADGDQKIHIVDLDNVAFTVQKKANLIYPALEKWMESGHNDLAKEGLSCLVKFLYHCREKGIKDEDKHLEDNMGFIGTCPMHIDFGHLKKSDEPSDPEMERRDIQQLLLPLKEHLETSYPELSQFLEQQLTFSVKSSSQVPDIPGELESHFQTPPDT